MSIDVNDRRKMHRSMEGPSWRWKLALKLAGSVSSWLAEVADDLVRQAASFVGLSQDGEFDERMATTRHSGIAVARSHWEQPKWREQFIILTLGDCQRSEIAERLNVNLDTVQLIEQLFFDVSDCRSAPGWINSHIILAESQRGSPELATKYRAAYWGGPLVAAAILDSPQRIPFDEATRVADREILLHMKLQDTLEIPLDTPRDKTRFLKIYLEHDRKKASLELAREKFRRRCERDIRKHELAERRLAAAARREESRTEARRTKARLQRDRKTHEKDLAEWRKKDRYERTLYEQIRASEHEAKSPLAELSWSSGSRTTDHVSNPPMAATDGSCDPRTPAAA